MSVHEYLDAISQDIKQEEYVCADGRIDIVTHVKVWPEMDLFAWPLVLWSKYSFSNNEEEGDLIIISTNGTNHFEYFKAIE